MEKEFLAHLIDEWLRNKGLMITDTGSPDCPPDPNPYPAELAEMLLTYVNLKRMGDD